MILYLSFLVDFNYVVLFKEDQIMNPNGNNTYKDEMELKRCKVSSQTGVNIQQKKLITCSFSCERSSSMGMFNLPKLVE